MVGVSVFTGANDSFGLIDTKNKALFTLEHLL